MVDRYGVLPDPTKQLFQVAELRLLAEPLGIRRLELGENGGRIHFISQPKIDPMSVIRMIQSQPKLYSMDGSDKLRIRIPLPDTASRIRAARGLINTLQA
jgi:transcription-repair coupling factor (superfamily II helicase)